jgi:hypothetical protein
MPDEWHRTAVKTAELYADALVNSQTLCLACDSIANTDRRDFLAGEDGAALAAFYLAMDGDLIYIIGETVDYCCFAIAESRFGGNQDIWEAAYSEQRVRSLRFLHDIFGNPFRPVTIDPRWLTSSVFDLSRAIYEERAWERMPVLADALMDAGCDNEEIINHCRGDGPHVRGCWVVDLLLGKK